MKDESKDPDTIDGAVRVAQLVNRSSFKETLGFLIIFVILVYLLKRLFFRYIFSLGYHILIFHHALCLELG